MNKKAQGLSVNVIIIVAIALIVLVVLVAVFTGRLGAFSTTLGEQSNCEQLCTAQGYTNSVGDKPADDEGDAPAGLRDGQGNQCYCEPSKIKDNPIP